MKLSARDCLERGAEGVHAIECNVNPHERAQT